MTVVYNLPFFSFLGLSGLFVWRRMSPAPAIGINLNWEDSLFLLSGAAYACLLLGILGLRRAYFLLRKKPLQPFSIRSTLLLVFLLPFLVTLIPIAVQNLPYRAELFHPGLMLLSLRIWLPTLQVFSLGCVLLLGEKFDLANFRPEPMGLSWWVVGLAGLGLWLAGSYSYHLGGLLFPDARPQDLLASSTRTSLAVVLVLALPILEGLFFRGRLLPKLQIRIGATAGIAASAGISALLTMQPILWIPAFLAGLGFNYLAAQPGGLRASIYAHIIFDALALLIIPGVIL
jgi:membrane protease YdiL (CAAX protease family)